MNETTRWMYIALFAASALFFFVLFAPLCEAEDLRLVWDQKNPQLVESWNIREYRNGVLTSLVRNVKPSTVSAVAPPQADGTTRYVHIIGPYDPGETVSVFLRARSPTGVLSEKSNTLTAVIPAPAVVDECNTTSECKAKWGATSTDCLNSRTSTSVCMCGNTKCSTKPPTTTTSTTTTTTTTIPALTCANRLDLNYDGKVDAGDVVLMQAVVSGGSAPACR